METSRRLRLLHDLALLDTAPEPEYDNLVRMAARMCGTVSAALTLVDERRAWPKARFGALMPEVPCEVSLCAQAIAASDLFVVEDARRDARLQASPLVTGEPHVVFYACMPLTLFGRERVGALAVFDATPRRLDADAADMLKALADQAVCLLQARLERQRHRDTVRHLADLQLLSHVGTWELDIDNGALKWSDQVYRIFGMKPQVMMPSEELFNRVLHPQDRDTVRSWQQQACVGFMVPDLVHRIVHTDGAVRHVRERAVLRLSSNRLGGCLVGIVQDVTQEHRAAMALQAHTAELEVTGQRFRLVCRLGRLGAWDFDVRWQVVRWDEALFHVFGFEPHEQPDVAQIADCFASPGRELLLDAFEKCCRDGVPYDLVLQMTSMRGEVVWTRSIGEAVRDASGCIVRVQGAFQDITQQMQAVEKENRVGRQLEVALERMSDAFYLMDRDWRMLYFNRAAEQVLSTPRTDVLGRRIWDVFPALVGSELERAYRDVMSSGCMVRLEYHYSVRDRWYDVTAYPSDEGLAVYFRDITERRARIETWRMLAEAMPLIVWTAGTDGRVDYVSAALSDYAGVPIDQLVSAPWDAMVHEDDRARGKKAWDLAAQTRGPFEAELRLRRADGTYRWHIVRASLMPVDKRGTCKWYGSSIDIDDNKRLEQSARALAHRLEVTMESITDGIFALDRQWRFTVLNRPAEVMLERARDELLGRNIWEVFAQTRGSEFQRQYEQCMTDRRIVRFDEAFEPLGKYFEVSAYPSDEGITVYFRDITELKHAQNDRAAREVAERANQAKSRFLAHISHELRTPLNAILGFSQLMLLDAQSTMAETHLLWVRKIQDAGQHLLDMVNEMLDLARIEAGGVTLRMEHVDIHATATACMDVMELQARGADVQLIHAIPPELPLVLADALRLRQVLLNLVSNAVKYNRRNGWVRVAARIAGDRVAVDVEDTGQGLSDEQLAQLFQPFNRLGAEDLKVEGTGLGLVIARRLAQLMHGDLRAARREGGGSVFTLELPLAGKATAKRSSADSTVRLGSDPATQAIGPLLQPRRTLVLYIEDDPVNTLLVQHVLAQRPQYTLHVAEDGSTGLAKARQLLPDVVLIDLNLPDMSGLDVLQRLRDDPLTCHLRCIALSADAMPHTVELARKSGFDDFWTKPIDVPALMRDLDAQLIDT